MATSTTGGPPHWLNEEVTIDFLKNKVRFSEKRAIDTWGNLDKNGVETVRTLLGFSEQELMKQIELEPEINKKRVLS